MCEFKNSATDHGRLHITAARFPPPIKWVLVWHVRHRRDGRVACWLQARHARKAGDALGLGRR